MLTYQIEPGRHLTGIGTVRGSDGIEASCAYEIQLQHKTHGASLKPVFTTWVATITASLGDVPRDWWGDGAHPVLTLEMEDGSSVVIAATQPNLSAETLSFVIINAGGLLE